MMLLAQLRASGAEVSLSATGGINLKSAPAYLVEQAKAQKAELVSALRSEGLTGQTYQNSALYYRVELILLAANRIASAGILPERLARFVEIVKAVDVAAYESLKSARDLIATHAEEVLAISGDIREACAIVEGPMLEGKALDQASREILAPSVYGIKKPVRNAGAFA